MKKHFLFCFYLLFFFTGFSQTVDNLYSLENKKSLFVIHDYDDLTVSLCEPIEEVKRKFGEPEKIIESKNHPEEKEEYLTLTLSYPDFDILYWKGFPRVRYIKLKTSNCYISERQIRIGQSTIAEVLDLYRDLETHHFRILEDEVGKELIQITFRTFNKEFMADNSLDGDYYNIVYTFDYKSKLCISAWMVFYDD